MRAEPEEVSRHNVKPSRFPFVELLLALGVIAALAAFWFWSEEKKPEETAAALPEVVVPAQPPELPPTPDIPVREEVVTVTETTAVETDTTEPVETEAPPPLTVADGDAILRQQLSAAGAGAPLTRLVSGEQPLDLSAALIDGLGRGIILRKMLPLERPKQAFSVDREGDSLYMSPASYNRYNAFTDAVTTLNTSVLVETFHTLRPLYQQTYEQLGLDPEDFDNAIIRTLDMVLATPEIAEPIALKPKSVVYVYADPALESLPALQKQLLRMGPDNLRRIKKQARVLREGLLAQ
ncbi:MAG: DUF3014 domain-containing protein [Halioglobus sp.]|jgi:hypothetical protein|nr:DUF3014 domain-containing protein [Halioglobus sp.]